MKPDLDHPCKLTCSGWQQGYDRGRALMVVTDSDSELKALAEKCLAEYEKFTTEQCAYFGFCSHDSVILAKAVLRLQVQLAEEEDKFK